MQKIIGILALSLLSASSTIAQEATPRNSRIASTELSADATESRFIDGLSLEAPVVKNRTTITVTPNKNNINKNVSPANRVVVDKEPNPEFKDKRTAKTKLLDEIKANALLVNFIDDWYGTPYRLGGTSKKSIDCSAFTRTLLSEVYGKSLDRTAAMQFMMTKRIYNKEELKEGDLVFFSIKTKRISHVGVYVGQGKFVHASSSRGVMVSDLSQSYWERYYAGAGRL